MVRKIILFAGIIFTIVIIGIALSTFLVPPNPITCQSPFEIRDGQCLCPSHMHEIILDDGSKSCKFNMVDDDIIPPGGPSGEPEDFCKEFPELC